MILKCRYSVVHPVMLGVMIAAAVFLHGASSLDPPRFQVSALPQNIYHYGTYNGNVLSMASMGCIATVMNLSYFQSRWFTMKSMGGELKLDSEDERILIRDGFVIVTDHIGTNAIINQLSYRDNGTYRCEIQENDATSTPISEWASATIQLMLEVRLESTSTNNDGIVRTFNDSQHVELSCDMSGYIHPDEDLYWVVNGVALDSSNANGTKYSISYRNGDNVAQFGGASTIPSRVTELTVFDVTLSDSGTYSCAIRNTDQITDVNLQVIPASRPSGYPQGVKARPLSSTSIEVTWEEVVEEEQNGNITNYKIHYTPTATADVNSPQQQTTSITTKGPVRRIRLRGLEEYTVYSISVRALTIVGSGPLSPPVTNRTLEDAPSGSPQNLMIESLDKDSLQVAWERPSESEVNGMLRLYRVVYCGPVDDTGSLNSRSSCTQLDVKGDLNSVLLSPLKEATTYNISVAAVTIGIGPSIWKLAKTRTPQLPLQPRRPPVHVVGIVIGVVFTVLAVVVISSIIMGIVIRDKYTRKQHRKMRTPTDGSQASSVIEVPTGDSNFVPVPVDDEIGEAKQTLESPYISVGEELTEPISPSNSLSQNEQDATITTGDIPVPFGASVQPKLELSELLKDAPPQYSLFKPSQDADQETASQGATVNAASVNFDASAESARKSDIESSQFTVYTEQESDTKHDLLELLQPECDHDSS